MDNKKADQTDELSVTDISSEQKEEKTDETTFPAEEAKEIPEDIADQGDNNTEDQSKQPNLPPEEEDSKADENKQEIIIDYTGLSKEELVARLKELMEIKPVNEIRSDIDNIKINFYKKYKDEVENRKKEYIEGGGNEEDFKTEPDQSEKELKELLKKYRDMKADLNRQMEVDKQNNLEVKYQIIEEIKALTNGKESINKTFHEFRELQKRWREIGPVPQRNLKDLWETYHYNVELFYDYIKINKELRDLDLKKNLEAKIQLCEQAEELLLEPSIRKAFEQLQELHNKWREAGPVARDKKDEIWERFKESTSIINKKHQEYYENLKKEQQNNLESKTILCEKAEDISNELYDSHKVWEEKSNEMIELQKMWKTIGFAPKKHNNKIYERFKKACDAFFIAKREYYKQNREEQNNNIQLKTDLCIQAESLQDNTDWKKTTSEYINLQKAWKEIGPVPRKHSEQLWKRFRAACDAFFNNKEKYYSSIGDIQNENLAQKQELIEKVKNFKHSDNIDDNINKLKEFQNKWIEIGHVPYKNKEKIQKEFRNAINAHFDNLKMDDYDRSILRFRNKLEMIGQSQKSYYKIETEKISIIKKLKKLENDIVLLENNIGFFSSSGNSDSLIKDVRNKIDRARSSIELLKEKLVLIDNHIDQQNNK